MAEPTVGPLGAPSSRRGRPVFEIAAQDGAGRVGELTVPRAGVTVETPALLPVVNPRRQSIEPSRLASDFGADILITNAYIIHGDASLRRRALEEGLHAMLGFDGAVMTDSGSFQLAEYGAIDVGSREILEFQRAIGSDVATPVDLPTPPDADRHRAVGDLAVTERRLREAAELDAGDMLVSAPIQGGRFPSLRERAARRAYASGLDVFPVGAVVPLLNDYRFDAVASVVDAAKRGLGADAPVHLFGAGHPIAFALAVAMGCDLFDSAAYALYARDGRYLTERGTLRLEAIRAFPCACPICTAYTPTELREDPETGRLLAEHNLHASFAELRRVKQAVRDGNLFELVEARARAHPALLDGYRRLLDAADRLERSDPATKGTFFHLSPESARRPEVRRHHRRLVRLDPPDRLVLVDGDPRAHAGWGDGGSSSDADGGTESSSSDAEDAEDAEDPDRSTTDGTVAADPSRGDPLERWALLPPFGPVPPALAETVPVNAERPTEADPAAYDAAIEGVRRLLEAHPHTAVALDLPGWPADPLARLEAAVREAEGAVGPGPGSTDRSAAGPDDEP